MKRNIFIMPLLEVIIFENNDIITLSGDPESSSAWNDNDNSEKF